MADIDFVTGAVVALKLVSLANWVSLKPFSCGYFKGHRIELARPHPFPVSGLLCFRSVFCLLALYSNLNLKFSFSARESKCVQQLLAKTMAAMCINMAQDASQDALANAIREYASTCIFLALCQTRCDAPFAFGSLANAHSMQIL